MNRLDQKNVDNFKVNFLIYSKRHNKFPFSSPAKTIYGSFFKVENEISNVVSNSKK